jgi:hypothetical protein
LATLEILIWCVLIGVAWLAAIRAPAVDERARDRDVEEEQRQWYAADLRNQVDRGP